MTAAAAAIFLLFPIFLFFTSNKLLQKLANHCGGTQSQPPLLMQTRAPTGPGSVSMDLLSADLFFEETLPADLGAQLPPPPSAPSCRAGSSLDGEPGLDEASKCLARMIALGGHDPSIVDDVLYFRTLLLSLKPEFTMPSRVKIEEECDRIFDEASSDLLSRQSSSRGRVSLAVGRTKTVDKEFMYVTWNFIDEGWLLRKLFIDAFMAVDAENVYYNASLLGINVMTDHEPNMFTVLDHISDHGISNSLFMLTSETNDREFCISLKDEIQNIHLNSNTRTREIHCTTYVDKLLHAIANCFIPEYDGWSDDDMSAHVKWLHLTREERQQLISHLGLDDPWIYHDENWYAMYCSLKVLRVESTNATDNNSTSKLLCKVWEKIHHAIQRISASSYPSSHLCFEILLNMRKFFQSELAHLPYGDIEDGLRKAGNTLDGAINDSYLVWSIPLALDPRYKLGHIHSIFKEAFESEAAIEYISKVEKNMIELYVYFRNYRKDVVGTSIGAGDSDSGVAVSAGGTDGYDPIHQWDWWPAEWKRYLSDPAPPAKDFDILKWWKGNNQNYPTLAWMASDALSMPTCSKPSYDEIAQIRSIVRGYSRKSFMRPRG